MTGFKANAYSQKVIYQLDAGAYKPAKAHEADAGFDLFSREDVILSPDKTSRVDTGVHVLIPDGYVLQLHWSDNLYRCDRRGLYRLYISGSHI